MVSISIIIPTKNRTQDIVKCIESISIQTLKPDEVLVVDSSDTEKLKYTLNPSSNLNIRHIHIQVDKKFKGSQQIAMNRGLDESSGDILIFLDDDVILDRDYIKNMVNIFKHDTEGMIGGVTGEVVGNEHSLSPIQKFILYSYNIMLSIFLLLRAGNGNFQASGFPTYIKSGSINAPINVEFLYGCNMAFRKEILSEFRFDENLNIHGCCFGDDDEIAYRISRKYHNIFTPYAKVVHNMSPVRANKYAKNRLMIMNHHYLFKKNMPRDFKHTFAFWWSVMGLFVREGIAGMRRTESSGIKGLLSGLACILKGEN